MEIKLYNNKSDSRYLNKDITEVVTLECEQKAPFTIESPNVIIRNRALNFNYCFIPYFNRYYYIENIMVESGERLLLSLKVDVLMSHKNSIKKSSCIASRSSSNYNLMIPDDAITFLDSSKIELRKIGSSPFTHSVSGKNYILTLGGN